MRSYTLILLAAAALFFVLGAAIYRGKTDLIHDYHQEKVTDKKAYGKAFGKAMFVMAAAMLLSGLIALLGEAAIWPSLGVLLIGLAVGIGCICAVQKKYNGGLF